MSSSEHSLAPPNATRSPLPLTSRSALSSKTPHFPTHDLPPLPPSPSIPLRTPKFSREWTLLNFHSNESEDIFGLDKNTAPGDPNKDLREEIRARKWSLCREEYKLNALHLYMERIAGCQEGWLRVYTGIVMESQLEMQEPENEDARMESHVAHYQVIHTHGYESLKVKSPRQGQSQASSPDKRVSLTSTWSEASGDSMSVHRASQPQLNSIDFTTFGPPPNTSSERWHRQYYRSSSSSTREHKWNDNETEEKGVRIKMDSVATPAPAAMGFREGVEFEDWSEGGNMMSGRRSNKDGRR